MARPATLAILVIAALAAGATAQRVMVSLNVVVDDGRSATMDVHEGEDVREAARLFCEKNDISPSEETINQLTNAAINRYDQITSASSLREGEQAQAQEQAPAQAQAREQRRQAEVLPADELLLSVPVTLELPMPVYAGDTPVGAAQRFARKHGVAAQETVDALSRFIVRRITELREQSGGGGVGGDGGAQQAPGREFVASNEQAQPAPERRETPQADVRVHPAASITVLIGDERVPFDYFEGEDAAAKARAFARTHNLDEAVEVPRLIDALRTALGQQQQQQQQ